jgi:hypothetical protein
MEKGTNHQVCPNNEAAPNTHFIDAKHHFD